MCRSGLCTSTPAGGAMSAAVTLPGPCLRRYMTTGSSCSEETTSSFRFRMMSVTSSLTPGTVENSCSTPSILMQGTAERVTDRVAETRLERLDDEPGPELSCLLFGEGGTLGDKHVTSLSAT